VCVCVCVGLCPDWEDWTAADCIANATEAMDAAEQWLDVAQVSHGVYDVYSVLQVYVWAGDTQVSFTHIRPIICIFFQVICFRLAITCTK